MKRSESSHSHRRSLRRWLAVALVVAVAAPISFSAQAPASPADLVTEAERAIVDAFAGGPVDRAAWAASRDALASRGDATDDDARAAIRELLAKLAEPSTRLLTAGEFAAFLTDVSGEPGPGVGLLELLSIDVDRRTGLITVVTPVPGSPAARAGLKPGDTIESIDGWPTRGASLSDVAARLRGQAGTAVRLRVRHGRRASEVTLVREVARPFEPVTSSTIRRGAHEVGYVVVRQFTPGAGDAVRRAVEHLAGEGVVGYVVDLRANPGGLLTECAAVAGAFLGERPIARIRRQGGALADVNGKGTAATDRSVVVLVDEGTASAAEVVAGALRDVGGARLVGKRTFGKGLVHEPRQLSDGSVLLVSTGRLITPNGTDILADGLRPDVDSSRAGASDTQLARALREIGRRFRSD